QIAKACPRKPSSGRRSTPARGRRLFATRPPAGLRTEPFGIKAVRQDLSAHTADRARPFGAGWAKPVLATACSAPVCRIKPEVEGARVLCPDVGARHVGLRPQTVWECGSTHNSCLHGSAWL